MVQVRVEAYDAGLPTSLQTDLDLTILVRNINDHPPQFTTDTQLLNFTENKQAGQERALLLDTVDLDQVQIQYCMSLV